MGDKIGDFLVGVPPEARKAYIAATIAAAIIFFVLQFKFFRKAGSAADPKSPSSFFDVKRLVSYNQLVIFSSIYAITFSLLFFTLALLGGPLVGDLKDWIIGALIGTGMTWLEPYRDKIAVWLYPFVVLGGSQLRTLPVVRDAFGWMREAAVDAFRIRDRADEVACNMTTAIADRHHVKRDVRGVDVISDTLEGSLGSKIPLPPELLEADFERKAGYMVLYAIQHFQGESAVPLVEKLGISRSATEYLIHLGIISRPPNVSLPPMTSYWSAGVTLYSILCATYVLFVPACSDFMKGLFGFLNCLCEWPSGLGGRWTVAAHVVLYTFSVVIPFMWGLSLFRSRRKEYVDLESKQQSIILSSTPVFWLSFGVNLAFYAIFVARSQALPPPSKQMDWQEPSVWVDIVITSVTPCVLVLLATLTDGSNFWRRLNFIIIALGSSVMLFVSEVLQEAASSANWRGYYWHQLLLGFYLLIAFAIARLPFLRFSRPVLNP